MTTPGVMLQVHGDDVQVAVNHDFSTLPEPEQRRILDLCRDTLDLALGHRTRSDERWVPNLPKRALDS